jgi:circadian clock protein KaiC
MKKRTGKHETTIREYDLTGGGIRIGGPLAELQGVLTGTPFYESGRRRPGRGSPP